MDVNTSAFRIPHSGSAKVENQMVKSCECQGSNLLHSAQWKCESEKLNCLRRINVEDSTFCIPHNGSAEAERRMLSGVVIKAFAFHLLHRGSTEAKIQMFKLCGFQDSSFSIPYNGSAEAKIQMLKLCGYQTSSIHIMHFVQWKCGSINLNV